MPGVWIRLPVGELSSHIPHGQKTQDTAIRHETKGIQIEEEVKWSLLEDDKMLYVENPKDNTKKLLELINEFSKVAGYEIHIQKTCCMSIQ